MFRLEAGKTQFLPISFIHRNVAIASFLPHLALRPVEITAAF